MIKKAVAIFSLIVNCKSSIAVFFTILFSLFTIHYSLFTKEVHAQAPCPAPTPRAFTYGGVIDDVNKCAIQKSIFDDKIFNWNQIVGTADSLNVLITGRSLNHPETDSITADAGALAGISRGIALAYAVPPASGVEYFADKIHDFNPVKPAYAQTGGIGFTALSPVKDVWGAFRNASYVAFIIVFVIMGFMIMFRTHISPQAVATVQDSIPRIVIALILVTFSYAIAGLLIDLMYVIINIAIAILGTAGLNATNAQNVFKENIFRLIFGGWEDLVSKTASVIGDTLTELFNFVLGGGVLGAGRAVAWILGWVGGIILGIALLFIMVKVFFMLLTAYIMIIILTIFAPFFFLIQALPGRNGASEWFKQMIANIAVFPAVVIMFLLAGLLGGITYYGGTGQGAFSQDFNQSFRPPLLTGGITAATLGKLIAIGIVLATPTAAETVKNFLGVKGGGVGLGAGAVGAGLAGGLAVAGAAGRRGGGALWERGPIAERMEAGRLKRQEAAAGRAGLPTFASAQKKADEAEAERIRRAGQTE